MPLASLRIQNESGGHYCSEITVLLSCVYILSVCTAAVCSLCASICAVLSTESKLLSEVELFTCKMPPRQGNASLDRPKCDKPFNAQGTISCLAECFRLSAPFSLLPFPIYIIWQCEMVQWLLQQCLMHTY